MTQETNHDKHILQFEPPSPVYRISVGEAMEVVVQEPLMALENRTRIAIPNPWNTTDEARFLPGIAFGEGDQFVMDVGQAFGQLAFDETEGWRCTALLPKRGVVNTVIEDLMEKLTGKSFTERLIKKAKPKKSKA